MTVLSNTLVQRPPINVIDARKRKVGTHGTPRRDLYIGSDTGDVFNGGDNADSLYGNDGNDRLHGGKGADALYGGSGNDTLYGDAGNDTLLGGTGDDEIYGGAGNDFISGMEGNDTLYGNSGADTLNGGDGNDTIYLGRSNANTNLENCKNFVTGGFGNDMIYAGYSDFDANGGNGFDIVSFIYADKASDGPAGVLTDLSKGTFAWGDYIFSATLKNIEGLIGTKQNDLFYGDKNANFLSGGLGDDDLYGRGGRDTLIGGEGNDTYILEKKYFSENVTINYDSGHDQLILAGFNQAKSKVLINQVQGTNDFIIDVTDQDSQKWQVRVENGWAAYRKKDFGIIFADANLKSFSATFDTSGYFSRKNSGQQTFQGGQFNDFMTNGSAYNRYEEAGTFIMNGNQGDDIYEIRPVFGDGVIKIKDDWTSGAENNVLRLNKETFGADVQKIKHDAIRQIDGSFLIKGSNIDLYIQNSSAWASISAVNIQLF